MRRASNLVAAVSCFLAIATLFTGNVQAQTLGALQGVVSDDSQMPVPGVTVKVTNTETGYTRNVFTDTSGLYRAPSLQPGVYSVEATLEGMQGVKKENIRLLVGQVLDINLTMGVSTVTETITVTAEAPVVEVSRSSAAKYVSEEEITNIPIAGRDFVDFALLMPTVKAEPDRGGISLAGQRGVNSGLNIDGTAGKSAFFGYGRGGEATENDGLVVSQDSVKEFQVITNGFAPEFGQNGGGYVNVVTKSGTNDFKGTAFFLGRNESLVSDLKVSELNEARGNECAPDGNLQCEPAEFKKFNWGASLGGPIIKDKTHFFASYDQVSREDPFLDTLDVPGVYTAVLGRFPQFVEGYELNDDGTTATGRFNREVSNLILFGKIDHQLSASNSISVRYNFTDYERTSQRPSEEQSKPEKTHSMVAQLVSLFGNNAVNEFRVHYAKDDFERRSIFEGGELESELFFNIGGRTDFIGKANFLPIFTGESKFQIQDNFSYLFGDHDLKFGFDFQRDNVHQLFAGFADGQYEFQSIESFLNDEPFDVQIFYGNVNNPNFDENQSTLGIYAQDSWKPNANLTLNFGVRWDGTFNPTVGEHYFDGSNVSVDGETPDFTEIPDDLNNFAPRLGFAYTLGEDGKAVVRGGAGLFFSRTPMLLWATVFTANGLRPNVGTVTVRRGQPGFVELGDPIDNSNPPAGTPISASAADEDFQDPSTWRFNLGYEREVATNWSVGADLVYAHAENLQSNNDINRTLQSHDEFGRPIYATARPNTVLQQIFVRTSPGWSNYYSGTLSVNKRFSNGYQVQAHYTYSRDEDSDSNERTASAVTISDITDIGYDYGLSTRDVAHRFVLSGLAELPLDFKLSGAFFIQSGTPWTSLDVNSRLSNYPGGNGPRPRAVIDGELVDRGDQRNDAYSKLDLRLSKFFDVNNVRIEAFGEVFNAFNTVSFDVGTGQANPTVTGGAANSEYGLGSTPSSDQRQFQLGARVSF